MAGYWTRILGAVLLSAGGSVTAYAEEDETGCIQATDAVAGDLRKVVSRRQSTQTLVTNWHLATAEPLCIIIDGSAARNVTDIQVVFAKGVNMKKVDSYLGMPLGVKGHMIYPTDDSFTAGVVVMDASTDVELDDSGSVKRK